jgi:hypothetical protein
MDENPNVETVHVTPAEDDQSVDPSKDSSPADPAPVSETPLDDDIEGVGVDPSNSPPAAWTEPMTPDEVDSVADQLNDEFPPADHHQV